MATRFLLTRPSTISAISIVSASVTRNPSYIQKFNRKIIVVKYGGSAMSNEELQKNVIKDVTLLKLVGFKPIIVHGERFNQHLRFFHDLFHFRFFHFFLPFLRTFPFAAL